MIKGVLPCWRCDSNNVQICHEKKKYYVACSQCPTISPIFTSPLAAAKAWNDTYLERKYKEEGHAES